MGSVARLVKDNGTAPTTKRGKHSVTAESLEHVVVEASNNPLVGGRT